MQFSLIFDEFCFSLYEHGVIESEVYVHERILKSEEDFEY